MIKNRQNTKLIVIIVATLLAVVAVAAIGAALLSTDKKGTSTTNTQASNRSQQSKQALPANFPEDVPLYEGVVTAGKSDKSSWVVTVTTNNTIANVTPVLSQSFTSEGWTTRLNNSTAEGGTIVAEKGNLHTTVVYGLKDGQTAIVYAVTNGAN